MQNTLKIRIMFNNISLTFDTFVNAESINEKSEV